jgi:uncharacterized protein (TIGR02246 family)
MKTLKMLLISVPLLALVACGGDQPENAEMLVENANYQWNTAFNQADSVALATLYSADATVSAGDGNVLNGRQEIQALFAGYFENGLHNHTIVPVEIYAVEDQIVQIGEWSADVRNDNDEVLTFQGILMTVLQKNADEEWQVVSHVWNLAQ